MKCGFVYALLALGLLSCARETIEYDVGSADAGAEDNVEGLSQALSTPVETPIVAVADTFIRKWDDDTNYGGVSELRAEGTTLSSDEHGLVRFDSAAIASAVGTHAFKKAELELTINHIPGFYGDGTVSVHRMTMAWTEMGATWDCANDTATWNFWSDCTLANRWGFDWGDPYPQPYVSQATASKYVSALQTGTIRFDVTADVQQFLANPSSNRGWLIKAGRDFVMVQVHFKSRETTDKPRLLITHNACGNGVVDPGEDCDDGIACGAGSCHLGDVCTRDAACTTGSCAFGIAQQFGLPPAAGVCWNPTQCATTHPPSCGAQSTMCPCCIPDCGPVGTSDGCGGSCLPCVPGADSDHDGTSDCEEQNDGRTDTNSIVADSKCGNGVLDPGESCDTALSPNCTSDCLGESSPTVCYSDGDCGHGQYCPIGNGSLLGNDPTESFCVPKQPCQNDASQSCGTPTSACGSQCACIPDCASKSCGDDPSDGCGGTCANICQTRQAGCRSNAECPTGNVCGIGVGPRFGYPAGANVCILATCDDYLAEGMQCGAISSPCGTCPVNPNPALPHTLCGASCTSPNYCNSNGQCVPQTALDKVAPLEAAPHRPTDQVGKLPGSFSVSQNGSASYAMPIEVPPGRGGMEPKLALQYDSSAGAGFVGLGWSLTGLPAVTRCAKIYAIDGEAAGVRSDASDAFCLGGDRLVPTSGGVNGGDQTEYRTELDSFTKVVSYGPTIAADGTYAGPRYFKAWYKSGQILSFGVTPGSRRLTGQVATAWYVDKFEDHDGNSMSVIYENYGLEVYGPAVLPRTDIEENRPMAIYYTAQPNQAASRMVLFHYDNTQRQLLPRRFLGGAAMRISSPLASIETYVEGELVRTYNLNSHPSGVDWLLDFVKLCVPSSAGPRCLPATTFTYDENGGSLSIPVGSDSIGHVDDTIWKAGPSAKATKDRTRILSGASLVLDMNGDGLDDLLQGVPTNSNSDPVHWMVRFSTGSVQSDGSFFTRAYEPAVTDATGNGDHRKDLRTCHSLIPFDFNEDGRDDFYADCSKPASTPNTAPSGPRYIFVSNPSPNGGGGPRFEMNLVDDPQYAKNFPTMFSTMLDLDGDARLDYVLLYSTTPCTFDSCAGRTYEISWRHNLGGLLAPIQHLGQTAGYDIGDFDTNGVNDLLVIGPGGGGAVAHVNSSGLLEFRGTPLALPPGPLSGRAPYLSIDVNGDGVAERVDWTTIITSVDEGVLSIAAPTPSLHFLGSSSSAFERTGPNLFIDSYYTGKVAETFDTFTKAMSETFVMDRDNDGLQELYVAPTVFNDSQVWQEHKPWDPATNAWTGPIGTPIPFLLRGPALPSPHQVSEEATTRQWQAWQKPLVMDINGDGVKDLVTRTGPEQDPAMEVRFAQSRTRHRLKAVANGMGQRTDVEYEQAIGKTTPAYFPQTGACHYPQRCVKRMPNPVVAAHTETGQGGRYQDPAHPSEVPLQRRYEYEYGGGRTDLRGRGFLGFTNRRVSEFSRAGGPSVWTPVSVTDSDYDLTTNDPSLNMYWRAGRARTTLTTRSTQASTLAPAASDAVRTSNTWELRPSASGRRYVALVGSDRTETEGSELVDRLVETSSYDGFGNLAIKQAVWGPGFGLTTTTTTQYESRADLVDQWLIALPRQIDIESTATVGDSNPQRKAIRIVVPDYDDHGRPRVVERYGAPDGGVLLLRQVSTSQYDAFGNPTTVLLTATTEGTGPVLPRTTHVAYDAESYFPIRVTKEVEPGNLTSALATKVQHDARTGRLAYQEEPSGDWQAFEFDGVGRPQWANDKAGRTSKTTYVHGANNPLEVTVEGEVGTAIPKVQTEFNSLGLPTLRRETRASGAESAQEFAYDDFGRLITEGTPHFTAVTSPSAARYTYDDLGRLTQEDAPYIDINGVLSTSTTRHMYAARARAQLDQAIAAKLHPAVSRVRVTQDPVLSQTVQGIGRHGALYTSIDANGNNSQYAYGAFDHMLSVSFAGASSIFLSDELGNTKQYSDSTRGKVIYLRNALGEVDTLQRSGLSGPILQETKYTYDGVGRLVSAHSPDGDYGWEWDGDGTVPSLLGRLAREIVDSSTIGDSSTRYDYLGPLGAISRITRVIAGESFETGIAYNAQSLPSQVTYPGSAQLHVGYSYNEFGQVTSVTDDQHGSGAPLWKLDATAGLDAFGDIAFSHYANGVDVRRTREAQTGRVASQLASKGSSTIQNERYVYDPRGLLLARGLPDFSRAEQFVHDPLGRLTGYISTLTDQGEVAQYGYDARGNLTTSPTRGALVVGGPGHAPDELVGSQDGSRSYGYDALGNRLHSAVIDPFGTSTQDLVYTAFDLPRQLVEHPAGGTTQTTVFQYDASNQRIVRQTSGGDATTYVGELFRRELHPNGVSEEISAIGLPDGGTVEMTLEGGTREYRYAHVDPQGSVRAVSDASGALVETRTYEPFGKPRQASWSTNITAGYTGHEHDRMQGLINMRGRMYDPAVGRFLTPDPVLGGMFSTQGQNAYSYVLNSPMNLTDPTGFDCQGEGTAGMGGACNYRFNEYSDFEHVPHMDISFTEEELQRQAAEAAFASANMANALAAIRQAGVGPGEQIEPGSSGTPISQMSGATVDFMPSGSSVSYEQLSSFVNAGVETLRDDSIVSGTMIDLATELKWPQTLTAAIVLAVLHVLPNGAAAGEAAEIDTAAVRFTQSSVKGTFSDGRTIQSTVDALKGPGGGAVAKAIPPVRIFEEGGVLKTLDNRRLLTFSEAGRPVPFTWASPGEVAAESWKFTATAEQQGGWFIRVKP
jgi:RHS repeat-associated protein